MKDGIKEIECVSCKNRFSWFFCLKYSWIRNDFNFEKLDKCMSGHKINEIAAKGKVLTFNRWMV